MITTIILGIFSVLFAFIAKYKNTGWGLKVSFSLIFLFLALRYNLGNDYETYRLMFSVISQSSLRELFAPLPVYEPAWVLLNWLFRHIGFFAMNAVLALFSCAIYYRFITKYLSPEYYWLAIFLYIFHPGFLLLHSTAMRQAPAIMLFVFSFDYLYNKDAFRYFLCILLASLFHYSAIILLPLYLLVFFNRKIGLLHIVIFISIFVSLFIFGSNLSPYVKLVITNFSEKYDAYQNPGVVSSGLGFFYYSVLFIMTLYFERMQNREVALVFKIAIISFLMIPLPLIIDMTGRLLMYFTPATIIVYPFIRASLKKPISKIIFSIIIVVITLFQFFQFFYSETYHKYFIDYHTIFSASKWQ